MKVEGQEKLEELGYEKVNSMNPGGRLEHWERGDECIIYDTERNKIIIHREGE